MDETIGGKAIGAIFWHALRSSLQQRAKAGEVMADDLFRWLVPFDALSPAAKGALFDACFALLQTATAPRGGPRVRHRMCVTVNGHLVASPLLKHAWDFADAKVPMEVAVTLVEDPGSEEPVHNDPSYRDRKANK